MAADRLTNKEIAQALFVTIRTVEMHLGNAYRKLWISSRKELSPELFAPADTRPRGGEASTTAPART
jgi:DNA-binding CsgD family transcriptional regulator